MAAKEFCLFGFSIKSSILSYVHAHSISIGIFQNLIVPQSTDTQFSARETPQCARSTPDIMVQVRQSMVCVSVR